jgi:hypothetical protein
MTIKPRASEFRYIDVQYIDVRYIDVRYIDVRYIDVRYIDFPPVLHSRTNRCARCCLRQLVCDINLL